ncbi:hypothetical protein TPE_1135 [Treponema pedis str. T A4]|uniref:Uncharacterized protein n=1 Tax=Treponema pedis str. T A4 TaxID=1291379 RepID=S6A3J9_9SPIR|nr:hypothetical protein TPE_1135 [Treponema pedis str. T A4]
MLAAVTVFAAFGLKKFRTTYMTEEVFVNVNEYTKKMNTDLKNFSAATTISFYS